MMQSTTSYDYTYKKQEGNNTHLEVNGVMDLSQQAGASPLPEGAEFKLTGTYSGTVQVDTPSGMIKDNPFEQTIKGNIEIQGMQIPFNMTGKGRIYSTKL